MTPFENFKAKAPKAMNELREIFGFSLDDVAAIMGNAGHESRGLTAFKEENPTVPGSFGGWGWFQWTGWIDKNGKKRRRKLFWEFADANGFEYDSDEANFGFLVKELKGSHKAAVKATKDAVGLEAKVVAFEKAYEKAGVKHYPKRLEWAKRALKAWKESGLEKSKPPVEPKETAPVAGIMAESWALNKNPSPGEILDNVIARKGAKVQILDASQEYWWKIKLVDPPDALPGWAPRTAIDTTPDAEAFEISFAKECVKYAAVAGVSGHYLLSVAHLRTKVTDGPRANGIDEGPFAISPKEWEAYTRLTESDVSSSMIVEWRSQCLLFARMTNVTQRALASLLGDEPTYAELYLAQIIGSKAAALGLRDKTQTMETLIANISEDDVVSEGIDRARIAIRYPEFVQGTVQDAMVGIEAKLQESVDATRQFMQAIGGEDIPDATQPAPGSIKGSFAERLASICEQEHVRFAYGKGKEHKAPYYKYVKGYWVSIGNHIYDGRDRKRYWSSAFVCFCVRKAGADDRFEYKSAHCHYTFKAMEAAAQNDKSFGYLARRPNQYKPKVGDIICAGRETAKQYDYDEARAQYIADGSYPSHGDIVVEVQPSRVKVIGGNVDQSVSVKYFKLKSNGQLKNRIEDGKEYPWIAVLECIM